MKAMETDRLEPTRSLSSSSTAAAALQEPPVRRSMSEEHSTSRAATTIWTWLAVAYQTCQSFSMLILTIVVITLGLQIHWLKGRLDDEDAKIDALVEQLKNQQNVQQNLNERVEQEHSFTVYQVAGTFTLLTCLLTAFHMTQHVSNYQEPVVQRKIVAILWMSPVYSLTSFIGLVAPTVNGYLEVLKDFYEAYVIYTFLSFLIAVLGRGDRETAVNVLAKHADHLKPPTKCLSSCYHPQPDTSDEAKASAVLMECQILAMQFVLVRPVTSILRFVTGTLIDYAPDDDDPYYYFKSPKFYISMITNLSVFFAFNGLLKFYHAVQEDLRWCKPFSKFMSIKGIVFLTFWQGLLISIIVNLHVQTASTAMSSSSGRGATANTTVVLPVVDTSAPTTAYAHHHHGYAPSPAPIHRFLLGDNADYADGDTSSGSGSTAEDQAALIQNFLICLEMLFFSIAHWCVFPAEEWAPDYRPKLYSVKPGMGLQDFASDLKYIVSTSNTARRFRRDNSTGLDTSSNSTRSNSTGIINHHRRLAMDNNDQCFDDDDHEIL
jgi:Organic solute transporter Ostalpha